MHNPDRKIVFFDIDGTLWDRHNFIPESTREAISRLRSNGHLAFINTGRTRGYITNPDLLGLGFDGIVSGCGTMVEYDGKISFLHEIDNELIALAITTMRNFGMKPIIEGKEFLYMEESDFAEDPYGRKLMVELGHRRQSIDAHWMAWGGSKMSCEMDGCDYEKCFDLLRNYYTPLVHNSHVAEIVPIGFSKGTGIEKACQLVNIPIENTIAVGDSVNDLEMLSKAHISIAMGGATDDVKSMATYTTADLMDDGIYKAMEHFGLI